MLRVSCRWFADRGDWMVCRPRHGDKCGRFAVGALRSAVGGGLDPPALTRSEADRGAALTEWDQAERVFHGPWPIAESKRATPHTNARSAHGTSCRSRNGASLESATRRFAAISARSIQLSRIPGATSSGASSRLSPLRHVRVARRHGPVRWVRAVGTAWSVRSGRTHRSPQEPRRGIKSTAPRRYASCSARSARRPTAQGREGACSRPEPRSIISTKEGSPRDGDDHRHHAHTPAIARSRVGSVAPRPRRECSVALASAQHRLDGTIKEQAAPHIASCDWRAHQLGLDV
jgi:hypothetical protein